MKNFKLKTLLLSLISASLVIGGMSIGASYMAKDVNREVSAATKITSYGSITTGGTYYIGATTSSTDYYLSVNGSSTSNSIAGTAVTSKASATQFVFTGSGTSWTIKFKDYNHYLGLKSSKDNGKVRVLSSAATFTASNQTNKLRLSIGSYSIQKNNGGTQFGSYGNTQTDIWLESASAATYKVTYNANGATSGTVPTDNTSYASGTTVTVKGNTGSLAKTGFTFSGWNTQADGNGTNYTAGTGTFTIKDNTTLYAKWSSASGETTASTTIQSYASAHSWSNSTQYNEVVLDSNITASVGKGGNNTGKYYTSGYEWRFYQSESATIVITAADGYELVSVTFTFSTANTGILKYGSTTVESGTAVSVSGSSATFSVANSGSATNGQVKFTAISVTYAPLSTHTVTISGASTVNVGSTITLTASCDHSDAITWKSSNTSIATVTSAGVVRGVAAGSVTITATCADGARATKTITVEIPTVQATGITFNPSSITMTCTRTTSFTATLTGGSGNYEKTIVWTSSNTSVIAKPANTISGAAVSITPTQVLTQTTVTLTATVKSPGSATASITITVNPIQQATGMSFSPSSLTLYVGQQGSFTPTLTGGETGKVTTISWSSNNPSVIAAPSNSQSGSSISVTPGYVASQTVVRLTGTVLSPGSATGYIDITVKPTQQATSMTITPNAITTYGLETESFTPTLSGGGIGHATTIVWTSSNESIIPHPSNSVAGNAVSITPNDPLVETEVTLTGTVNVTGGASASIVITVLPTSSRPLPTLAYTLDCTYNPNVNDSDDSTAISGDAGSDYFKSGTEYISSVSSSRVYLGKMSYDSLKFSASRKSKDDERYGSLSITLSSLGQLKATKIVLSMRAYESDNARAVISVNGATTGQTGYLETSTLSGSGFENIEVICNERNTIQTIDISAMDIDATNRFYLDYIEVWARPKQATSMSFTPASVTVESGTSTSFIPTLTGGTDGHEQTINWVSDNTSIIPSPKPTEEGENVIITAKEGVLENTTVHISGTVVSPGSATATITVTVTPYVPVDHYTVTGTAYGAEGDSKWNLSEVTLHAWRNAEETEEKPLTKNTDYKLNSHTAIRYTDDKLVTVYDALGFIEGEWVVPGKIVQPMSDDINFRDVTDTTGGQSYSTGSNRLTVTKGYVTVNVTGTSAASGYGTGGSTSASRKTTLHDGNSFTVSVSGGCELISVRAYGNSGPSHGIHLHMLSWSGAVSTDTSINGQSYAMFTNKISRSFNTPTSTTCEIEDGYTEIWGLEVVYSLPNPGPDATDPGANADDMIFNNANNTGVSVRTLGYYFAGGTGTSVDPFQIKSPTHLRNLAKLQNMGAIDNGLYFSLENSFNWSGEDMEPIGKDDDHAFHGFFKGNCHTIQGLVVTSTTGYAGMFGCVFGGTAGRITNLVLSSPTIHCNPTVANTNVYAGFVCGYVKGAVANIINGIMVYGGNENNSGIVKRATITANANAVVDSSDGTSAVTNRSVIVGGRDNTNSIGVVSFVASMNDIVISNGDIIAPKTGISIQSRFINQSNFTYRYYRRSGNSGAVVKE